MKKLRYFAETAVIETIAWILPRLPRTVLLALARGLGTAAFYLDKRGRTTALENLRAAFGKQYNEPQRRRIARGSYQTFARTFLDLFWSTRLTQDNWQPFFDIHIPQPEIEEQARRTGGVWVTPHFGNFELVSKVWGFRGFPFTVVAQDFKNPALTRVFKRLREQSGHTIIPQENAMIKLIKTLKRQGHAGLLTDLNIVPGKAAAAIQCFGLWTCVPTLHVELAKRLGLSIITGVCRPLPGGRYEARLFEAIQPKPEDDTRELTQRVWNDFEQSIRDHPECWMWMYKHWRYRPTDDVTWVDPRYPSYANAYEAFMNLIPEEMRPRREG
ncbi:MAG: lysophospholipid acyltransferase family protein [Verrucomicrobiaceae bacterium]|nr:lysophospholipid acyltransferase family protein [Verrucomicrobiaceae bacterium]